MDGFHLAATPPPETGLTAATLHACEAAGVDLLLPEIAPRRGTALDGTLDPLLAARRQLDDARPPG